MAAPKHADPIKAASRVRSDRAARKVYDELRGDLSADDVDAGPGWETDAEVALNELKTNWPGLFNAGAAAPAAPKNDAPKTPARAAAGGGTSPKSPRTPAAPKSPAKRTARPPARRGGGRSRSSSLAGRAWRDTGIPGAAESTTKLALQGAGWLIGLSLAYLLLTNANKAGRGKAAIEVFANGVGKGFRSFVKPVDPLAGKPVTAAPTIPSPLSTQPQLQSGPELAARNAGLTPTAPGSLPRLGPVKPATPANPSRRGSKTGTKKATPANP